MSLMETGGWLMPSTQAASHGAGQMRPVNSGKLLVECRRRIGGFPAVVVDQVVPVGNEIVDRAAGVAEGHAAIHAASALLALLFFGERLVDFEPVLECARRPCGAWAARD